MRTLIEWTFSVWKTYWDEGFYQYLLLFSIIYLLICKRKNKGTAQSLPFVAAILLVFFCTYTAAAIRACIGETVYWIALWMLPAIPVIALGATEFLRSRRSGITRILMLFLFVSVIAISGKGMLKAGNYIRLSNHQKIPNEVARICDIVREKAASDSLTEIRLAGDETVASYVRVYDPSILMPYGRWGTGALDKASRNLHRELNAEQPDYDKLAKAGKKKECNFLVLPDTGTDPSFAFEKYGYFAIGTAGSYTIYQLTQSQE